MTNEYGMTLDRNGYAESIIQQNTGVCYLCKTRGDGKLDRHEPWGAANRQKSKEYGMWVTLHHFGCHEGPGSVHEDAALARELRKDAQRAAMLRYGWTREEFIRRFGKSELSEEECRHLIILPKEDLSGPSRTPAPTMEAQRQCGAPGSSLPAGNTAGAGTRRRVGDIIAELFPDHPTTTHASGFRLIDGPELPF